MKRHYIFGAITIVVVVSLIIGCGITYAHQRIINRDARIAAEQKAVAEREQLNQEIQLLNKQRDYIQSQCAIGMNNYTALISLKKFNATKPECYTIPAN